MEPAGNRFGHFTNAHLNWLLIKNIHLFSPATNPCSSWFFFRSTFLFLFFAQNLKTQNQTSPTKDSRTTAKSATTCHGRSPVWSATVSVSSFNSSSTSWRISSLFRLIFDTTTAETISDKTIKVKSWVE